MPRVGNYAQERGRLKRIEELTPPDSVRETVEALNSAQAESNDAQTKQLRAKIRAFYSKR